ncbi:MAG: prephenate dehydratase [Hyphomicrobiales bacterium]|nr:MAG: prephenate dehydratase [Hyphomicrobiales bacterium]
MTAADKYIVFQGEPGANSHIACHEAFPDREPLPCPTFEDALAAIRNGKASLGMIPMENTLAGRVADIHHLLPESGLHIIGEHFLRVHHNLMAPHGVALEQIKEALSHPMALGQCRRNLRELGISPVTVADTAGAAREVAEGDSDSRAAIATPLAAEVYGLNILKEHVEDEDHNTTRFLILSNTPVKAPLGNGPVITSFVFKVRNVPAALFKALGGFATNGVNMTKLESYQIEGSFSATQFYADIEGHPDDRLVRLAMEELDFFTSEIRILGVYPASPQRAVIEEASRRRRA